MSENFQVKAYIYAYDYINEKIFEEAFEVAEIAKYTPEQKSTYESSLKAYRDNINVIETAREEG